MARTRGLLGFGEIVFETQEKAKDREMSKAKLVLGLGEGIFTPYHGKGKTIDLIARTHRPFRPTHFVLSPTDGLDVIYIGIGVNNQLQSSDAIPGEVFAVARDLDRDKLALLFAPGVRTLPDWIDKPDEFGIRLSLDRVLPGMDIGVRILCRHEIKGTQTIIVQGAFFGEEVS